MLSLVEPKRKKRKIEKEKAEKHEINLIKKKKVTEDEGIFVHVSEDESNEIVTETTGKQSIRVTFEQKELNSLDSIIRKQPVLLNVRMGFVKEAGDEPENKEGRSEKRKRSDSENDNEEENF